MELHCFFGLMLGEHQFCLFIMLVIKFIGLAFSGSSFKIGNNDARLILRRPYQESLTGQRHDRKPRIPTRTVDSCFDLVSDRLVANMGPKGLFNRGGGSAGMSPPKRNILQNRSIFGAFSTIFSRYAYVLIGLSYNACRVTVRHGCAHQCPQSSFIHVGFY